MLRRHPAASRFATQPEVGGGVRGGRVGSGRAVVELKLGSVWKRDVHAVIVTSPRRDMASGDEELLEAESTSGWVAKRLAAG